MIRLIQKKLIIPRGDTGTFSVPVLTSFEEGDTAIFSIMDARTNTNVLQKECTYENGNLTIEFTHNDTVNKVPGKYYWDIKIYKNAEFLEGKLINGTEVDSYYAAYSLPICEIRQTGDKLLTADENDKPSILNQQDFNLLNATLNEVRSTNTALQQYKGEIENMLHQEQRLETIETSLQQITTALQSLRNDLEQHKDEVNEMFNHEQRIEALENTIGALNTAITKLNNLIDLSTIQIYEQRRHNQPINLIGFNNCDGLRLSYEEEPVGNEVGGDQVILTIDEFKRILSMLQYYESITPFTEQEMNTIRGTVLNPSNPSGEEPAPSEQPAEEPQTP